MHVEFGIQGSGQWAEGAFAPAHFRALGPLAEEVGFDAIWAGDHVAFENPILDPFAALATFAATTERILLGTAIVLVPLRPAAAIAKQAASLDYLAGGRLLLGVGPGGDGPKDFEAVGVPIGERGARTDEAIGVLRTLLRPGPQAFAGRFARFDDVELAPASPQPGGPPILVGGRAEAALVRAGRLGDGWLGYLASPERFARDWATVRAAALAAGRDADAISPGLVLPLHVEEDGERARRHVQEHLSRRYGRPFEPHHAERYAVAGSPDECRARLAAYVEAGVRRFVFNPACSARAYPAAVEAIARLVVAPLRAMLAAG